MTEEILEGILNVLKEIEKQLKILNLDPEYWELVPIDVDTPTILPAGSSRKLMFRAERGKIIAMAFIVDNPYVKLTMRLDGREISGRPIDLKTYGLDKFNPTTFWLAQYDDTNKIYSIWYTPVPPMDYFGKAELEAEAPPTADVKYVYSIYRWRLKTG